jgi:hypothetical protein
MCMNLRRRDRAFLEWFHRCAVDMSSPTGCDSLPSPTILVRSVGYSDSMQQENKDADT